MWNPAFTKSTTPEKINIIKILLCVANFRLTCSVISKHRCLEIASLSHDMKLFIDILTLIITRIKHAFYNGQEIGGVDLETFFPKFISI